MIAFAVAWFVLGVLLLLAALGTLAVVPPALLVAAIVLQSAPLAAVAAVLLAVEYRLWRGRWPRLWRREGLG